MLFKELRYVFIDDNFTDLKVIKMVINETILTNEALMLPTEFLSNLMRMGVAIYQRYLETFFNLFPHIFVST